MNEKTRIDRRQLLAAGTFATAAGFGFNRAASARSSDGWITQTASFNLNPEKADEAIAMLEELVAAVEDREPGVLAYICHRKADDPNAVFFFEIYENEKALADHSQAPHLNRLRQAFGSLLLPPVDIVRMDRVAGYSR